MSIDEDNKFKMMVGDSIVKLPIFLHKIAKNTEGQRITFPIKPIKGKKYYNGIIPVLLKPISRIIDFKIEDKESEQ